MRQVSLPVCIAEGERTVPSLPSEAFSSPLTGVPCQLLYYSVPQASHDACGVVPSSSGIAMLLTPQQVFFLAATLDQKLCGIIPSGGSSPSAVVSRCFWTDSHSLGRWEACRCQRERFALGEQWWWHSSTHFMQLPEFHPELKKGRGKIDENVFLLGQKEPETS